VTFHDRESVDLNDPIKANKTVREDLGNKLLVALKHKYPDTQIKGIYSDTHSKVDLYHIVLSGEICDDALKFGYRENEKPNMNKEGLETTLFGTTQPFSGCLVQLNSNISGIINEKYAVVHEINTYSVSAFVAIAASEQIEDTYVVIPDRSRFRVSRVKRTWVSPYPKVIFNKKDYLLDINEVSTSPIL
jgi:hypothetical protein